MGIRPIMRSVVAASVLLGSVFAGPLAYAADAPGSSSATIAPTISLNKTRDLDFGRLIPSAANGRVTINARTGVRTGSASVTLIGSDNNSALFTGIGTPNQGVTISISSNNITLNRVGGGATMRVRRFRVSAEGGGQRTLPRNYNIPADGTIDFAIGGRLRVGANQAEGVYVGSFDITLEYQ